MLEPRIAVLIAGFGILLAGCDDAVVSPDVSTDVRTLSEEYIDGWLQADLKERSFDGRIEERLVERLGRPIHQGRAELGRLIFFDPILSLSGDNSCSGCHGPNSAFNDGNSIAIGVENNGVVGPGRRGPHNQRRAPTVVNAVFYQSLMWDSRFEALSRDPFDNSRGFAFPDPEGLSLSGMEHLLGAQAFTPVVARIEMAGFEFEGDNDAMRAEIVRRVGDIDEYQSRFADSFADIEAGTGIRYEHIAAAIAEFEFTLVRADAPLDRYARGDQSALSYDEKAGARLFFDEAMCAECHIVRGNANQMFSDFEPHVLAVPQVVPVFGNKPFDGAGDEDYGLEQHTGKSSDRYKFRTSPLRNVAYQPTFMHNGAYPLPGPGGPAPPGGILHVGGLYDGGPRRGAAGPARAVHRDVGPGADIDRSAADPLGTGDQPDRRFRGEVAGRSGRPPRPVAQPHSGFGAEWVARSPVRV